MYYSVLWKTPKQVNNKRFTPNEPYKIEFLSEIKKARNDCLACVIKFYAQNKIIYKYYKITRMPFSLSVAIFPGMNHLELKNNTPMAIYSQFSKGNQTKGVDNLWECIVGIS